jgi:hypothetical protein
MTNIVDPIEKQRAYAQTTQANFYAQALEISSQFRADYKGRLNVVKAAQMPFERRCPSSARRTA